MTTHTLSVLVENKPGVLAHVAALFSRRAFNITSLSVGPTASEEMLNARRENRPATCDSTPGLFSTSTESVCVVIRSPFPDAWRRAARLR